MWVALVISMAGGVHCAAMCSPLIGIVASQRLLLRQLIYHSGRILTYGILGLLTTSAGKTLPLGNYQSIVAAILGVYMLLMATTGMHIKIKLFENVMYKISYVLKNYFIVLLQRKNHKAVFLLGSINGLLPCGLTWIALTYCLTLTRPVDGFLFMSLFGVGTLPALFGAAYIWQQLAARLHWSARKISTAIMLISSALLITHALHEHHEKQHTPQQTITICR